MIGMRHLYCRRIIGEESSTKPVGLMWIVEDGFYFCQRTFQAPYVPAGPGSSELTEISNALQACSRLHVAVRMWFGWRNRLCCIVQPNRNNSVLRSLQQLCKRVGMLCL